MTSQYVISIKRITSYLNNEPLEDEDQFFEYVCDTIDRFQPIFPYGALKRCAVSSIRDAKFFISVEDAKNFINSSIEFEEFMRCHKDEYDLSSLSIRKIIFKSVEKINIDL